MKKKSQLLKQIMAVCLLIILSSCEKDLYDDALQQNHITVKRISLKNESLQLDYKLMETVNKVRQKCAISQNIGNKVVYDSINNFYFDDENGAYVEKNNYKSYTFRVFRTNNNNEKIENIIFSLNENKIDYDIYLIKYDITELELNQFTLPQLEQKEIIIKELYNNINRFKNPCDDWIEVNQSPRYFRAVVEANPCDDDSGSGGNVDNGSSNNGSNGNGGTENGGSGNNGEIADNGSQNGGTVYTTPMGGGGASVKTPCDKLKDALDPAKANVKQATTDLFPTIPAVDGENGVVFNKASNGYISAETLVQSITITAAGNFFIPMPVGGNIYMAIHTHPLSGYPMFSVGDVIFLNNLNNGLASHNIDNAILFLATIDDNGQNQLYAIMLNSINDFSPQNTIDDYINSPENAGCSPAEVGAKMDEKLSKKYDKQYNLGGIPNYERSFLHQMFGYNVSLYKANSSLTNFSQLKVNSLTGNILTIPCN